MAYLSEGNKKYQVTNVGLKSKIATFVVLHLVVVFPCSVLLN